MVSILKPFLNWAYNPLIERVRLHYYVTVMRVLNIGGSKIFWGGGVTFLKQY